MDDKRHIYGGHGCQTLRLKLVWDRRSAHIVKVYSHAGQSYIFFSEKQTNKQTNKHPHKNKIKQTKNNSNNKQTNKQNQYLKHKKFFNFPVEMTF